MVSTLDTKPSSSTRVASDTSSGPVRYIDEESRSYRHRSSSSSASSGSISSDDSHPPSPTSSSIRPPSFSSLKHRWEAGSGLCRPIFSILPSCVTWTRLCILNHFAHWVLFSLVLVHRHVPEPMQIPCLLVASIVNAFCVIIDGLTGTAAKGVGAVRVVEVVDHWLDAAHTPMIASAVAFALGAPPWMLVATAGISSLVFSAQMLIFHAKRVFIDTNGVEGRLGGSFLLILAAFMLVWPERHPNVSIIRQILSYLFVYVLVSLLKTFVTRFDFKTFVRFLQFTVLSSIPAYLYLSGGLSVTQFLLTMPFLSFRLNGSYALQSASGAASPRIDRSLIKWLVAMVWGHVLCHPIPLHIVLNKLVVTQGVQWIDTWCVQDVLPYAFCIYVIRRNLKEMTKFTPTLKWLSRQERTEREREQREQEEGKMD